MTLKRILVMLSLLMILLMCVSSASAVEDSVGEDNFTEDSIDLEDLNPAESTLGASNEEDILSAPKTIVVDEIEETHNEMGASGTIQKAIDSANAGDTIVINGRHYVHCHFVVDKKLTIISNIGTTMSVCPSNTAGSNSHGIFYVSPNAGGTVIDGFTLTSDVTGGDDYNILVRGASDVVIRNCILSNTGYSDALRIENAKNGVVQNVSVLNAGNGIRIKNSQGVTVKNSEIRNSNYGIYDIDSTRTAITLNDISDNKVAGISVAGTSNNPTISYNNLTSNLNAIDLTSSDNINILSNYFLTNKKYGVHIDCKVKKINIIGNFFYKNKYEEVFNDVNTKGLYVQGGEKLEVVNNNYVVSQENNRPVQREDSIGGGVFLGYIFEINSNVNCPIIYSSYNVKWDGSQFELRLSNITQSKKGVYSISIVDKNGNVAKGLSSVPVTFYLNKNNNYVAPQEGDVYKTVMMVDGTATVRFYPGDFIESGNVVTAVVPGLSVYLTGDSGKNIKTFEVNDSFIPGNVTESKITVSDLNTYPKSNAAFTVRLTDIYNNPIVNEIVTFTINSKKINVATDNQGKATIKINENAGSYTVRVNYFSDEIDYSSSSAQAKVVVKKLSTKIVASNYVMFIKKADYYQLTLKDSSNRPISGQKVTIKVNKKTYTLKTNAKGVAKVKFKLKKGTYKVVMSYKGSNKYGTAKKTTKIFVKKVLKTKLTAPKITTTPKTATKYTITLKDENGKVLKRQKVTANINGKKYAKKTNSKGQITIKVKFSKIKSYKVTATYKKTSKYQKSRATGKITVKKISTIITAPNMDTFPNNAKDYAVTLKTSDGKAIAKQTLKITLNGQTYTRTTNSNGQATIQTQFADEGNYKATVTYVGSSIYNNAKAEGSIKVSRTQTELTSYNRTFSRGSSEFYVISLKDIFGNALSNQAITYNLNNNDYSQITDENGQIKVEVSSLNVGSYVIAADYGETNQFKASSTGSTIKISDKTDVTFIDPSIPGEEIQARFDEAQGNIEFLGNSYDDVSLSINRPLNITFMPNTTFNGKSKGPVLIINTSNFKISDLLINANEGSGIIVQNAENVTLENILISNILDQSKRDEYASGELLIPGNGIELSDVNNVMIIKNVVKSFGNAIFVQNADNLEIKNNTLSLSNYGINYALGVKNTNISNNLITKNIGLYVMDVPEGPLGYGIFLNQSAVNVSITNNRILDNYMGISIDSNYSTGIVILSNWISDNALEGIRFNAGYDLAENAVEPNVNDNAIYRNAKGPSMMILGEMSANPEGIYQYGLYNISKRLQLGANWFGKNARITWDYDTNTTGYGTMCPRINATYISVREIVVVTPGTYSVTFYKHEEVASALPEFEMYATLNGVEVKFMVVNGVGTFSFDTSVYGIDSNVIQISIGSLKDQYRTFEVLLNKTLEPSDFLI